MLQKPILSLLMVKTRNTGACIYMIGKHYQYMRCQHSALGQSSDKTMGQGYTAFIYLGTDTPTHPRLRPRPHPDLTQEIQEVGGLYSVFCSHIPKNGWRKKLSSIKFSSPPPPRRSLRSLGTQGSVGRLGNLGSIRNPWEPGERRESGKRAEPGERGPVAWAAREHGKRGGAWGAWGAWGA